MPNSNIPNESEMDPEDFGSQQIKAFLEGMAKDVLPNSDLAKFGARIEPDGSVHVGNLEITKVYTLGQSRWKVLGPEGIEYYNPDPFNIIDFVMQRQLRLCIIDWNLQNYACVA